MTKQEKQTIVKSAYEAVWNFKQSRRARSNNPENVADAYARAQALRCLLRDLGFDEYADDAGAFMWDDRHISELKIVA